MAIKTESIKVEVFSDPSELFHDITQKGSRRVYYQEILRRIRNFKQSTMGSDVEDDFNCLFDILSLTTNQNVY